MENDFDVCDRVKLMKKLLRGQGITIKKASESEKEVARKYIENTIREIKKEIPELVVLLNILILKPVDLPIKISTDFRYLFYSPKEVIRLSKKGTTGAKELKFQVMHIVLHGLLGDNETIKRGRQSKDVWLAMDQRVNDICNQLGYLTRNNPICIELTRMKKNKPYSACFGNIALTKKNRIIRKKAKAAQRVIASDEHFFWSPLFVKKILGEEYEIGNSSDMERVQAGAGNIQEWKQARDSFMGNMNDSGEKNKMNEKSVQKLVQDLNKKSRNKSAGKGAGNSQMEVNAAAGDALDYRDILKELICELECSREIPDSIDNMLYHYGLDMYGDVPLIEPKEEGECSDLHTLVVAIDTSGSCCGEVASIFLREMNGIISESVSLFKNGEIVFIQCDDEIQNEEVIPVNKLGECLENMKVFSGWGGTSFVPVFHKIESLQREEDKVIDGLIYLTDGCGEYPNKEPDYPTIFVMDERDSQEMQGFMPEWIRVGIIEK